MKSGYRVPLWVRSCARTAEARRRERAGGFNEASCLATDQRLRRCALAKLGPRDVSGFTRRLTAHHTATTSAQRTTLLHSAVYPLPGEAPAQSTARVYRCSASLVAAAVRIPHHHDTTTPAPLLRYLRLQPLLLPDHLFISAPLS